MPTEDEIRRTKETERVLKEAVDRRRAEKAAKENTKDGGKPS